MKDCISKWYQLIIMVGKNLLFFVLKEALKESLNELLSVSPSSISIKLSELSELKILVLLDFDNIEKR